MELKDYIEELNDNVTSKRVSLSLIALKLVRIIVLKSSPTEIEGKGLTTKRIRQD